MILAFSLDADERALRDAIERARADVAPGADFDVEHWRRLGGLGALAVANDGASGPRELVAVFEALGASAAAGPLVETVIALAALESGPERSAIERGDTLASVGAPPYWPFGQEASTHMAIVDGTLRTARLGEDARAIGTLAGDPWSRAVAELGGPLPNASRAIALGRLAAAALLAAAGHALIELAAERARTRRQFGRSIGDHQAVAHPLADCAIRLAASEGLARSVARIFDDGSDDERASSALAAFTSARGAALAAAHQAHQTFGALGITREGPVFARSRRIRQWASLPLAARDA